MIWQEAKLKAARMHIYVRRGGPNYQIGLARMRALGEELGIPLEVSVWVYKIIVQELGFRRNCKYFQFLVTFISPFAYVPSN